MESIILGHSGRKEQGTALLQMSQEQGSGPDGISEIQGHKVQVSGAFFG
jgi:hypothetical protein